MITCAAVPVIVDELTVTSFVVLELRVISAAAETVVALTVIVHALPDSVMSLSVAISLLEIFAVMTPVVLAARTLN